MNVSPRLITLSSAIRLKPAKHILVDQVVDWSEVMTKTRLQAKSRSLLNDLCRPEVILLI